MAIKLVLPFQLALSLGAQECESKPFTSPSWMIKGYIAALSDPSPGILEQAIQFRYAPEVLHAVRKEGVVRERIEGIVALLKSGNPIVQVAAIEALSALEAADRIDVIAASLESFDDDVREAAIKALVALRATGKIDDIVEVLKNSNEGVRRAAIKALVALRATAKINEIVALLERGDDFDPSAEIVPLVALMTNDEIAALLKNGDHTVQEAALNALVQLNATGTVDDIAVLLKSNRADLRRAAIEALTNFNATDKIDEIAALLTTDGSSQSTAIRALASLNATGRINDIAELLQSEDRYVQESAIEALGELKATGKADDIAALLKRKDINGWAVTKGLVALNATSTINFITALLNTEEGQVQSNAIRALSALNATDKIDDIAALLKSKDDSVQRDAIKALAELKAASKINEIAALLQNEKSSVQSAAIRALAELKATTTIDDIAALLQSKDKDIQSSAIAALVELKATRKADDISALLKGDDNDIRMDASKALVALTATGTVDDIAKLLKSDDSNVQSAAIEALVALDATGKIDDIAVLLKSHDGLVQYEAIHALGNLNATGKIDDIAAVMRDGGKNAGSALHVLTKLKATSKIDDIAAYLKTEERRAAIEALVALNATGKVDDVAALLKTDDYDVRIAASEALVALYQNPSQIPELAAVFLSLGSRNADNQQFARFSIHLIGAGESKVEILLSQTGWPGLEISVASLEKIRSERGEAMAALSSIGDFWEAGKPYPEVRTELGQAVHRIVSNACPNLVGGGGWRATLADWIQQTSLPSSKYFAEFARPACWPRTDVKLLESWQQRLSNPRLPVATDVERAIAESKRKSIVAQAIPLILAHGAFWALLLCIYPFDGPLSRSVQSLVFWNPWFRKIAGLGYVGLLLTHVGPLRRLLLRPFRQSLLSDANLADLSKETHFLDQRVYDAQLGEKFELRLAIPAIRGQIVLHGESGAGKTWALRRLIAGTKRTTIFLPAWRCENGVLEAVKAKLQGPAQDEIFLKSLIHSGALDIAVDGLNEVSAAVRQDIVSFVEGNFGGNVILTCQPIEWRKPSGARTYSVVPLTLEQARGFLKSRAAGLSEDAKLRGKEYQEAIDEFFQSIKERLIIDGDGAAMERALQNPMDLTLLSEILADGRKPDLLNLQQQAFERAAAVYRDSHEQENFPINRFSERVFAMEVSDVEAGLPDGELADEVAALAHVKLMLRREVGTPTGPRTIWRFRHDKIRDFFLWNAFTGEHKDRQDLHIGNDRFRGVYLMLAQRLPIAEAMALRELVIEHAAEKGDHSLSDELVKRIKERR